MTGIIITAYFPEFLKDMFGIAFAFAAMALFKGSFI